MKKKITLLDLSASGFDPDWFKLMEDTWVVEVVSSEASSTITAGMCVIPDYSATDAAVDTFVQTRTEAAALYAATRKVKILPTGTATGVKIAGVALMTIAAGGTGLIVVKGIAPKIQLSSTAGIAAGDPWTGDGLAAGDAEKFVVGTHTAGLSYAGTALTSCSASGFFAGTVERAIFDC